MEADINIAKNLPYAEMAKFGWVPETKSSVARVTNLRKFFRVVSLPVIENSQINKIACRRLAISEKAADFWACDILIPQTDLDTFLLLHTPSRQSICTFANDIGVAPGIVVGRLQFDKKIRFSDFNDLKEHYEIA